MTVIATKIEMIRALKAMQTQTLIQRQAVCGMLVSPYVAPIHDLTAEFSDVRKTAEDHISAMQHCIDRLAEQAKP